MTSSGTTTFDLNVDEIIDESYEGVEYPLNQGMI